MLWLRRLVVLALFVLLLVGGWRFASRNAEPVHVDYLIGTLVQPGWAVLLAAFVLGAAATALAMSLHAARLALTARRYRKLAVGLEEEVHQLRNLPLAAPDDPQAIAARSPAAGGLGRSG
jgi:uncharacterized integral membrane protein